ncbi:tetrapyrrole methylase family protein/MazG family protein [Peribacillus deserti]|uniref:Tetrapyrrole methylase family protein/MazG family protein n=1 Tax=Peribacillus deserti TaxID=673318 RepID=A0ABS2QNP3_9BACI|nr:nucleoside triphosphate pyrophosphohydrolase [Peribacillus deserti]MBM7694555.1 tetrapyrrole methylase family protein/MazG family protein [Peribacillus deserti]
MANEIKVIGLGSGELSQIPFGIYKTLKEAGNCFVRTVDHPVIRELSEEGISFSSFDSIYEKHDQFEAVYEEISEILLLAAKEQNVLYAVPGHPMVAEKTVQLLLEKGPSRSIEIKIEGGQSFIDSLFQAAGFDPIDGFQLLDGTSLRAEEVMITGHVIIGQVYDQFIASEVKLTLMEKLPDDYEVYIITAAGSSGEKIQKVRLYELDHGMELNNLTSLYIPPVQKEEWLYKEFFKAKQIIAKLRGPGGCPWDQEQTHESLKKYLIEETYELIDAIDQGDDEQIVGELGDILLQVLLHAQIGEEEGMFSISDVIGSLSSKMVRRHPHVFGEVKVKDAEDVIVNWQKIKETETGAKKNEHMLDRVEKAQPQLLIAYEYQKKASKAGFDWKEPEPMWEKVFEEIKEAKHEIKAKNMDSLKKELGDIFFALVNLCRYYSINPEEAVHSTNRKFYNRFAYIEKSLQKKGESFEQHTLEQLDDLWEEAKNKGY